MHQQVIEHSSGAAAPAAAEPVLEHVAALTAPMAAACSFEADAWDQVSPAAQRPVCSWGPWVVHSRFIRDLLPAQLLGPGRPPTLSSCQLGFWQTCTVKAASGMHTQPAAHCTMTAQQHTAHPAVHEAVPGGRAAAAGGQVGRRGAAGQVRQHGALRLVLRRRGGAGPVQLRVQPCLRCAPASCACGKCRYDCCEAPAHAWCMICDCIQPGQGMSAVMIH